MTNPPRSALVLFLALGVIAGSTTAQDRPKVSTVTPSRADVSRSLRIAGRVEAWETAVLKAKVTGFVSRVFVDRGSVVEKDVVLATLSIPEDVQQRRLLEIGIEVVKREIGVAGARVAELTANAQASAARVPASEASVKAARIVFDFEVRNHERFKLMREDGSVTPKELEQAEERRMTAEAHLATLRAQRLEIDAAVTSAEQMVVRAGLESELATQRLMIAEEKLKKFDVVAEYTTIKAPFAGVVIMRHVSLGELVLGGGENSNPTALIDLLRTDKGVRIVVDVPEREVSHVKVGTAASITASGAPGDPIKATVTVVAGALEDHRALPVEVHLSDVRLIPGMSVYVDLVLETHKGVLTVPSNAIHREKKKDYLWLVTNGALEKRAVDVGFNDLVNAEIRDISPSARVVIGTKVKLVVDKPVEAVDRKESAK